MIVPWQLALIGLSRDVGAEAMSGVPAIFPLFVNNRARILLQAVSFAGLDAIIFNSCVGLSSILRPVWIQRQQEANVCH